MYVYMEKKYIVYASDLKYNTHKNYFNNFYYFNKNYQKSSE